MQEGRYRYLVETRQQTDNCEKPISKAERLAICSAAEQRRAKTKEILDRVFGSDRIDLAEPIPGPESSPEPKPDLGPEETFEAYQARLDGYASVRKDAEIEREKTRRRGGR